MDSSYCGGCDAVHFVHCSLWACACGRAVGGRSLAWLWFGTGIMKAGRSDGTGVSGRDGKFIDGAVLLG